MYIANIEYVMFDIIFPCLWILDIGIILIKNIFIFIAININNKNNKNINQKYINILKDCEKQLRIKRNIKIINQKYKEYPAIYGIINTKIIINENVLEKYTDKEVKFMFMHELSHYKGFDIYLNLILKIINTIHWFNPFCTIFFKRIRQDIELKADSIAIKNLNEDENKEYALTIIKALINRNYKSYETEVLNLVGIKDDNQRRIYMIKFAPQFRQKALRFSIISIMLIISLTCIFFVGKYIKIEENYFDFEYEDMIPYKVKYIGDFNKIKTLAKKLSLGRYIKYIQIDNINQNKPVHINILYYTYGNKETEPVYYKFLDLTDEEKFNILKKNTITLLSLIEDSDYINFDIKTGGGYNDTTIYQKEFNREELKNELK